jgi:hypothetical protein
VLNSFCHKEYGEGFCLQLPNNGIEKYLYVVEGVGAVFVAVFLVSYLAGLPTTNVLHADPILRSSLFGLGAALLVLILVGVVLAALNRRR